ISQCLLRVPIGIAADRWRCRRAFVLGGLGASAAGALMLAVGTATWMFLVGRALTGVAAACWVALLVLAVGAYPPRALVRAMTTITVVGTVAEATAVFAGGVLADAVGWTAPFYIAALLAGVAVIPAIRLPDRQAPGAEPASWGRMARAAMRPRVLVVSGVTGLVTLTVYVTTYGFVPVFAVS